MVSPEQPTLRLPDPRHLGRLPAGFSHDAMERIRQGAYNLPQVLTPGELWADPPADADKQLAQHGLILLQRAVPNQRPSRWIAPAHLEAALRHLESVGVGRETRALMRERAQALEALGLSRSLPNEQPDSGWERLVRQTLPVSHPAWAGLQPALQWARTAPEAAQPIWDYFRHGEIRVLLGQLCDPAPHPQAGMLAESLDALVQRGQDLDASQLPSLQARLQAECHRPGPLDQLLVSCQRAADRWAHQVSEQHTLKSLNQELAFQGYPDSFVEARRLQRKVTLMVGPPNSGKTYQAFERLAGALDGAYLAPLRLLALEGRDRLLARDVPCSLLTGEENVPAEGARVISSTIEMVNTRTVIDVAVIDEAQMIFDASRGWAWTQAIVGVPAREVLIICSAYAVPAIEALLGLCGETVQIRHFERKQQVQLLKAATPLQALKKGDAVVAFSRRDVLMLRDQIAAQGHPVSVVYGALPPEVRRREAERFAQGESHVLVATDAIGMGLNLPIRRVLFSTLSKFDGVGDRTLTESEVHQIAGRAGRFGLHEEGFTGVLHEAEPSALRQLRELLPRQPRAPRHFKAPVAPNWWHVSTISQRLGKSGLHEVLTVFMAQLRLDDAHFQVAELEGMLGLAQQLDEHAANLSLRDRFVYAQAPVDSRTDAAVEQYLDWAWQHARHGQVGEPRFLSEVDEFSRLDRMEQALRACSLWLWLDLRFPGIYGHLDAVLSLRNRLNDGIERHLKGKRPLWQARQRRR